MWFLIFVHLAGYHAGIPHFAHDHIGAYDLQVDCEKEAKRLREIHRQDHATQVFYCSDNE